jgi:hypothetical protein
MSNEKQQTAVDKLIEIYWNNEGIVTLKNLEQAKEMEKQRMIEFTVEFSYGIGVSKEEMTIVVKQFYEEIFGGENEHF